MQPCVSLGGGKEAKNQKQKRGESTALEKLWDISVFYFSVELKILQLKSNRIFGRISVNHIIFFIIKIQLGSKQLEPSKAYIKLKSIKSYILQYIPKAVFSPGSTHNYTVNTFFVTSLLLDREVLFSAGCLLICIHFPSLWTGKGLRLL